MSSPVSRLISIAALVAMSLLATSRPIQAAQRVSPRSLALRLTDMPPGFVQTVSRVYSNAQAAKTDHISVRTLVKKGRLTSYESAFHQPTLFGIINVDDTVAEFKSAGGAHWDYLRIARNAVRSSGHSPHIHAMSVGRLGNESIGYTYQEKAGRIPLTVDILLFRRSEYRVSVLVGGLTGSYTVNQAIHYAGVIDRRISKPS
jgi:hypothetical protein